MIHSISVGPLPRELAGSEGRAGFVESFLGSLVNRLDEQNAISKYLSVILSGLLSDTWISDCW